LVVDGQTQVSVLKMGQEDTATSEVQAAGGNGDDNDEGMKGDAATTTADALVAPRTQLRQEETDTVISHSFDDTGTAIGAALIEEEYTQPKYELAIGVTPRLGRYSNNCLCYDSSHPTLPRRSGRLKKRIRNHSFNVLASG
jgi:hypothetical protein